MKGLSNGWGFGSTELYVLSPGPDLNEKFWYYITVSDRFRRLGEAEMKGAAEQKRLPDEFIKNYRIPILPLPTQRLIAVYLDRETAHIDALIAAKERLLALLAEKRQALITRAVTRGLEENVKMKNSGVAWLGEVPEGWEVKSLKHTALLKSGDNLKSGELSGNGEYPVYGGNGLRGYYDSYTHEGYYILIGRQGALCGNINYANGKFWATEHAVVVTITDGSDTDYLGELLQVMNLNQYSVSAAQPGLSVELIGNLQIPSPPPEEQVKIGAFIRNNTENIDKLILATERTVSLLKERRSALISAAVTGQKEVPES